ncbi:hypothetical protein [Caulifigura coniformis]|nr:hypothetical protein [Caulifigura coniformis]
MAERQIIVRCAEGKWSAAYSDRPEERFYGTSMDEALDRLKRSADDVENTGNRPESDDKTR